MVDVLSFASASTTPGSNASVNGVSVLGTGLVSTADDSFRNSLALDAKFYSDLGGTGTTGGSANAITLTTPTLHAALVNGMFVAFKNSSGPNTTAVTLNVDAIGAKAIRLEGDSALVGGEMVANGIYLLRYDTAYNSAAGAWVLLNPASVVIIRSVVFTGSGTYTPNPNMLYCLMEGVGGGGGGGGAAGTAVNYVTSGGGGSGGYSKAIASKATIGASQTVTVGGGGSGGSSGANNGAAGSDTSVGALLVAKGGAGGIGGSSGGPSAGALGGVAGTGNILALPGNAAMGGSSMPAASGTAGLYLGGGAPSHFGGGSANNVGTGINAGPNTGAGGSGALSTGASNFAGGAGGSGIVIIIEFCSA